jgi:CRISPR-associated protein Cas2
MTTHQIQWFFCLLASVDLERLKNRLYDVINLDQDQVLFIPLCGRCALANVALGRPIEAHDEHRLNERRWGYNAAADRVTCSR